MFYRVFLTARNGPMGQWDAQAHERFFAMTESTKTALRAIVNADPTIDSNERAALMRIFRTGAAAIPASAVAPEDLGSIVKTAEVMERAGISAPTVRKLAARGILQKVCGTSGSALGYTSESVRLFLAGKRPQCIRGGAAPVAAEGEP